jgi:hypothetical protein
VEAIRNIDENVTEGHERNINMAENCKTEVLAAVESLRVNTTDKNAVGTELTRLSNMFEELEKRGSQLAKHQAILKSLHFHGIRRRLGKEITEAERILFNGLMTAVQKLSCVIGWRKKTTSSGYLENLVQESRLS